MKTFVQLGRYGDILNLLPLLKHISKREVVQVVVNHAFADVFRGVSYAIPYPVPFTPDESDRAVYWAEKHIGDVVRSQVWQNTRPRHERNFTLEQWSLVGSEYVKLYHQLPLEFDRRDSKAEQIFKVDYIRPLVLYNFSSHSSPFEGRRLERILHKELYDCQLVDLSRIQADRYFDLLGLFEQADVLVTVDTASLHLGYATQTPTIALSLPNPFLQSEKRPHWIERFTYDDWDGEYISNLVRQRIFD